MKPIPLKSRVLPSFLLHSLSIVSMSLPLSECDNLCNITKNIFHYFFFSIMFRVQLTTPSICCLCFIKHYDFIHCFSCMVLQTISSHECLHCLKLLLVLFFLSLDLFHFFISLSFCLFHFFIFLPLCFVCSLICLCAL